MRYLRAAIAVLLLVLLLAGFPLALALTIGNPLHGWDALRVGDVSDDVLLDVLATVAWAAWASFLWAVISEILTLATRAPRPQLPGTLPGPQHLAHTLITAAFLILPSTTPLLDTTTTSHTTPTATAFHPTATTATPRARAVPATTLAQHPNNRGPAGLPADPSPRTTATHRAGGELDLSAAEFALGAGVGLVTGISLRELAHLRRRQWRHRRPGRAIPATPPDLARIEKALTRNANLAISVADRTQLLAARANTRDEPMPPARGQAPWDAFCDAAGAPLPQLTLTEPNATTSTHNNAPPTGTSTGTSSSTPTPSLAPSPGPQPAHPPRSHTPPTSAHPDTRSTTLNGASERNHNNGRPDSGLQSSAPGLSVLEQPLQRVLSAAATTARDVGALAPRVHEQVRRGVQEADPALDDDLAEWNSERTHRPRFSVLGTLRVRACGQLPNPRPRVAWHTEVLAYLAAHPRGVTPEKFGTDLWPDDPDITSKPKLRHALFVVRHWLGTNPSTGREYVPPSKTPAGVTLYRVEHLLIDGELFRRLRLRGVTRGPEGIHDLERP